MSYWPKTMFLALLDLVLVNIYILWKLIHYGTPQMKTREDFNCLLAEEMFFYTGFEPVAQTRSKVARPPSPAVVTPKSKKGKYCRELNPHEFPGHERLLYETMPKKTRHNAKGWRKKTTGLEKVGATINIGIATSAKELAPSATIPICTAVAAVCQCAPQSHCGLTKKARRFSAGTNFIWNQSSNGL